MEYMKYRRLFVLMTAVENAFGTDGQNAKGDVRIEFGNRKGAMRCTVQGLCPTGKESCQYKLIFLGTKKERTIYALAGDLAVNGGCGETLFRFDPVNFDGKGNSIADFSMIVVAAVVLSAEEPIMHPVLTGMLEWEENSGSTKIQEGQEVDSSAVLVSGVPAEANSSDLSSGEGETKTAEDSVRNYNGFYNQCLLQFCTHTCEVSGYYKKVKPFAQDETGAVWNYMANIGNLPLMSPGAQYFASQYRHYLFGVCCDESGKATRYFFAIPGRNLSAEQPDGGASGFLLWQAVRCVETKDSDRFPEVGAHGYWILAVNAETGDIEAA